MSECKTGINEKRCNCSYSGCSRKYVCCDCLHYHRQRNELPACYFPNDVERSYDRSISSFIDVYQKRRSIG